MKYSVDEVRAGATLTIDLSAIRKNWQHLAGMSQAGCAAVLKADAYGLGIERVAPALEQEGCNTFFVAHLEEGIRLRRIVSEHCTIYVLHGPPAKTADEFLHHKLVPVLNAPEQVNEWRTAAFRHDLQLPAAIQVDTGMSRMGLAPTELAELGSDPNWLQGLRPQLLMSHLACADEPEHPINTLQRQRFDRLRLAFPGVPRSLANSSGVFLGPAFHYDLLRPGAALYGINPQPGKPNPLLQAVSLSARIIQTRTVREGDVVGYGARFISSGTRRIATVAIGYADGWLRAHGNNGQAFIEGVAVPFVGRVSMDSITLDVTTIAPERVAPGMQVNLLGPTQTLDEVAAHSGTIGYELLTRLGSRFYRQYLDV